MKQAHQPTLADLRREYASKGLNEAEAVADPVEQLRHWLDVAIAADLLDATAMCLSTVSTRGVPSSRVVLLKKLDHDGLTFFTRHSSRKARELHDNAHASVLFHWREFNRQVRVTGTVTRTGRDESLQYFQSRPRESRLAARVASGQTTVTDRATLERLFAEQAREYPGDEVPMPEDWGGYRIKPDEFEFWQGRENRLHDRLLYRTSDAPGVWVISRLAP